VLEAPAQAFQALGEVTGVEKPRDVLTPFESICQLRTQQPENSN
jgi:hypothetical protein